MPRSALTVQQRASSADAPTPFAAFATSAAHGGSPKQWPRAAAPRAQYQLMRSPFLGSDMSSAAVAIPRHPRLGAEDRQGSLQDVPSLTDWASPRAAALPSGHSTERLPSLHDWIMPMLPSSGSLPKPLPPLFGQTIPEASAAPDDLPDPALLHGPRPARRRPSHHGGSRADAPDAGMLGAPLGASPEPFHGGWRSTAPRSPGRHAAAAPGATRGASVSPKRGRNLLDEDVFVGSFEDAPQPQKSPRLGSRAFLQDGPPAAATAAAEPPAAAGSLSDSGPGFAEMHAVINTMWKSTSSASRVAGAESARVG
jgi:hypothetical protein